MRCAPRVSRCGSIRASFAAAIPGMRRSAVKSKADVEIQLVDHGFVGTELLANNHAPQGPLGVCIGNRHSTGTTKHRKCRIGGNSKCPKYAGC